MCFTSSKELKKLAGDLEGGDSGAKYWQGAQNPKGSHLKPVRSSLAALYSNTEYGCDRLVSTGRRLPVCERNQMGGAKEKKQAALGNKPEEHKFYSYTYRAERGSRRG